MEREHHQSTNKKQKNQLNPMNRAPLHANGKDKKWLRYLSTILNQSEEF